MNAHRELLLASMLLSSSIAAAPPSVTNLRTEYKVNPIGIDIRQPRLSWQLASSERNVVQAAYQIQVAEDDAFKSVLWDSGRVPEDRSIHVPYAGPALLSGKRYHWRVRVWDAAGQGSDWSAPAFWEMGLLSPGDWKAKWITPDWDEDTTKSQPSPMLRGVFRIGKPVRSARAYATSLGLYELHLNGARVGDQLFTPGWTSYRKRLQYQTYDITAQLRQGENVIGVILGDGWYRGYLGWRDRRNTYGERLAALVQLQITFTDGSTQTVSTDESWRASTGPILSSDIYMGETYDARLEKKGWSAPGYDASGWRGVRILDHSKEILIAPEGPPVRRIEEIRPVKILRTPAGDTVVDMGQNMVGWVRLKVRGPAGATVTLRHAEVLDKVGNFYTANLRGARQTVRYTLRGDGEEVFEPHFSFQGFRYVAVDGFPGELSLEALTGIVIHSDMRVTGRFETSNPLLNQLQHNIVWGQKGNFLDVPTDCPQRDERLGWTGDAQVFSRTAAFNMDVASFFTKWLADLAADQNPDGKVPHVIPDVLGGAASAAWADAATIVPWNMYTVYGDTRLLERQYPSMKAWVEYMRRTAGSSYLWNTGQHFGDWLAFATTRSDYPGATTGKDLIATAFYAHSTELLARTAAILGREEDARFYGTLADRVRQAFVREFVTPNGRIGENTQTAYALALQFELIPESMRLEAVRRLVADIDLHGHLTTGFVGASYLTHVLTRYGRLDVAYRLLNREAYPSWLYPVKQGATTIWERWDGIRPDGTFQDPGMNSFNHYAYGAIGDWMYRVVAGLDAAPDGPGYKHILIHPRPGGGLSSARATLETMYGTAASGWRLKDGRFELDALVPPNARATIRIPNATLERVSESGRPLKEAPGLRNPRQDGADVVVEAGSGDYRFVVAP
jgi:alpha-L-rhamnosidase